MQCMHIYDNRHTNLFSLAQRNRIQTAFSLYYYYYCCYYHHYYYCYNLTNRSQSPSRVMQRLILCSLKKKRNRLHFPASCVLHLCRIQGCLSLPDKSCINQCLWLKSVNTWIFVVLKMYFVDFGIFIEKFQGVCLRLFYTFFLPEELWV